MAQPTERVLIIDFGSQYSHLIVRRVRGASLRDALLRRLARPMPSCAAALAPPTRSRSAQS